MWRRRGAISFNHILRFNTSGALTAEYPSGRLGQGDMAIDRQDILYVPQDDLFSDAEDGVYRVNANGNQLGAFGQATAAASGCISPESIAFDANGHLLVL